MNPREEFERIKGNTKDLRKAMLEMGQYPTMNESDLKDLETLVNIIDTMDKRQHQGETMNELERVKNKLCDEQAQLFQKLYRLDDFIQMPRDNKIISTQQLDLMWMQRNAMKMYIDVLQLRINELQERINNESEVKKDG